MQSGDRPEIPAIGAVVRVERRKWPDAPHYGTTGTVLGHDDRGVWVGTKAGSTIVLPDGSERRGDRSAIWYVPHDDWYLLHYWHEHPEVLLYVDICTPAVWTERGARTIDLDFDVIVWCEAMGRGIELVDVNEFEEHRVALGYPDALVADARRAAADVLERVRAARPPFDVEHVRPWLDRLEVP